MSLKRRERLTSVEQSLVKHVGRGEWLDLAAGGEVLNEAAMRSWGESRTCRASVIRDILRGRLAADPEPRGLRLRGARITGRIDLENLTTDINLVLEDCLLEEGVLARGARLAILNLTGCQIEHHIADPLDGARLTCNVLILTRARIIGRSPGGAVNLTGAHIGSNLECSGADLRNDSGPALFADGLQVDHDMFLTGRLTGSGGHGAVNLTGAHIGGNLDCSGANLSNHSGPSLLAYRLQLDGDMLLTNGFIATGSGDRGAVRLTGAHIGGNLACYGASLDNDSGPALLAYGVQIGQDIYLTGGFAATGAGGGKNVTVNLRATRVGGAFEFAFDPKQPQLTHLTDPDRLLLVDGLTYLGVPQHISGQHWRDLLRDGTPYYAAQPYQQLAAGYRALGDDRQARQTLMRQRDDQLTRAETRCTEWWWGWITKVTLGYGYQPWRALLFLVGVVALSCVLAVALGAHGALTTTDKTRHQGQPCTVVQQISVGLDLNLPVGTSVARAKCDLTKDSASVTAAWLTAVGWVLRVLAWVFAALFIAGFTSAVRKT